jgi:hypothetical protein
MKSPQEYIDQVNQLLNELIQVSTQLRDLSLQVVSEEDLAELQKRQEELLNQIENIDQQMRENIGYQLSMEAQEQLHDQLQAFQQLNQEFIQNLSASHGLIQFESHQIENPENQNSF